MIGGGTFIASVGSNGTAVSPVGEFIYPDVNNVSLKVFQSDYSSGVCSTYPTPFSGFFARTKRLQVNFTAPFTVK